MAASNRESTTKKRAVLAAGDTVGATFCRRNVPESIEWHCGEWSHEGSPCGESERGVSQAKRNQQQRVAAMFKDAVVV